MKKKASAITDTKVGSDGKLYHRHEDGSLSHQGLPTNEKDIQKSILEFLAIKGIFAYRQNSGGFMDKQKHYYRFASIDGLPDIVAIIGGRYVGIEVKKPGGKVRASQVIVKKLIEGSDGIYWLFDSLDEAVDMIESYIKICQ